MPRADRRSLRTGDVMLLVASAAVAFGAYQWAWRTVFGGWTLLLFTDLRRGAWSPDARTLVLYYSDLVIPLVPLAAAWTVVLPLIRFRPPRPSWRRAWRQPGMSACFAAVVGGLWGAAGVAVAATLAASAPSRGFKSVGDFVKFFFVQECFMYVGLAVASAWAYQALAGGWRRTADPVDFLGRVVGVGWLLIGFAWTLRGYIVGL